jgi:hypothetical protein
MVSAGVVLSPLFLLLGSHLLMNLEMGSCSMKDSKPVAITNVRILEVHVNLVLCGITDQTFVVREGEIGVISLVV